MRGSLLVSACVLLALATTTSPSLGHTIKHFVVLMQEVRLPSPPLSLLGFNDPPLSPP